MPQKTTRHWAKRKLCSGKGNIDQCGQHLFAVSSRYSKAHPEISTKIDIILAILQEVDHEIDIIEKGI